MSNYYLCDTCGNSRTHAPHQWWCPEYPQAFNKRVMTDDYEHPHEVCPHWKPKEDE